MLRPPATLGQLMETFKPLADGAGVVFETSEGEIGAGYHVTELKLAHFDSIDCGGNRHRWSEAHLQLLDAPGSDHMRAGKFSGILRKSVDTISELRDAPFYVEFALENKGIERFRIEDVEVDDSRIAIALEPGRAACKPAMASGAKDNGAACCGPQSKAACSC